MKSIALIVLSFFSIKRAFEYTSQRRIEKAHSYLRKNRFKILSSYPNMILSIEYSLLDMFIQMQRKDVVNSRCIFTRIRISKKLNYDEKNFLTRYALGVLWIARGRQGDCLLKIRHKLEIRSDFVRQDFRSQFPSPDLVD